MVPVDGDFSHYKVIVAPVLYMVKDGMAESLEAFVKAGGTLVTGFMSGIVDQSDNVHLGGYPGPLRNLCGVWAEEIDALAPEQTNTLRFTDGEEAKCGLLCDILHLEGAESSGRLRRGLLRRHSCGNEEPLWQRRCLLCRHAA